MSFIHGWCVDSFSSSDIGMSVLDREGREACWAARDAFFRCLDTHGGDASKCKKQRAHYENICPKSWACFRLFPPY